MTTLWLIGIGTGNPDHVTGQAIKALNAADLILIPRKGTAKSDLAEVREQILSQVLTAPVPVADYDVPLPWKDGTPPEALKPQLAA